MRAVDGMRRRTTKNESEMLGQARFAHPGVFFWVVVMLLDLALATIAFRAVIGSGPTTIGLSILVATIFFLTIKAEAKLLKVELAALIEKLASEQMIDHRLVSPVTSDYEILTVKATEVLGGREAAMRWLGTPVRALDFA